MQQVAWIGGHFRAWSHREFILFSILPVLAAALTGQKGAFDGWQQRLQRLDRALVDAAPSGRPLLLGDGHRAGALRLCAFSPVPRAFVAVVTTVRRILRP